MSGLRRGKAAQGNTLGMTIRHLVLAACTISLLGACQSPPTQRDTGMVIGGILGGVIGHEVGAGSGRTAATIIGTLIGASIGGAIGRSMDEQDRVKTAHALESVRTGVPSRWTNPDTGHRYAVTPIRTYDGGTGPCREYTVDAIIGGKPEKVVGTACRQADGSWRAMP
ncbi:MAG TPA: glycine zipper domain-containing protein [Burkholderiaceae bacterium]|nr:glycine zipper domain-containing protein [Burkholderiaceae bacterium]